MAAPADHECDDTNHQISVRMVICHLLTVNDLVVETKIDGTMPVSGGWVVPLIWSREIQGG